MLNISYKAYISTVDDPRFNLSLEEYFMSSVKDDEVILLFWQSKNAVVIGRNQNPYQECNITNLREDDVTLVRRLSGGGAVYHDLGNLNFAFIAKSKAFSIERQFSIILDALKNLNIHGEFNGRNDLIVNQRKFSGNAFIHDEDNHLHHGTILVNSDVNKIKDYLSVSHLKLDNKGFDSVKSRVINLNEVNESLSIQAIIDEVMGVINESSVESVVLEEIHKDTFMLRQYMHKYMSHEWNYGDCPTFEMNAEKRYKWGMISIHLNIDNGVVKHAKLFTDALNSEGFSSLIDRLNGLPLTLSTVEQIILEAELKDGIKSDLKEFLIENLFE
jgi:lipoate-protein ligase A